MSCSPLSPDRKIIQRSLVMFVMALTAASLTRMVLPPMSRGHAPAKSMPPTASSMRMNSFTTGSDVVNPST